MRHLISVAALALFPVLATAADGLDWAYPVTPRPEPLDTLVLKQAPGSERAYTQAQIDDAFNPPDWFPDEHPTMPPIVARGEKPAVRACALCHLPSGDGHPESSSLAGLPVSYLMRQLAAFKSGDRTGVRATTMITIAQAISDADALAASEYFASLKPGIWTDVIETETVPKTYVGAGGMRFVALGDEQEPVGNRIIVLPQEETRAKSRDPHSGFVDYVPPGSIARGEALVTTGDGGKTIPCGICHGQTLQGLGEVPAIAGRPPTYIVRQLNDMKTGARSGISTADEGGGREVVGGGHGCDRRLSGFARSIAADARQASKEGNEGGDDVGQSLRGAARLRLCAPARGGCCLRPGFSVEAGTTDRSLRGGRAGRCACPCIG
jgi:cytochrome c553